MSKSARETSVPPNVLVISDLHLGEELMPGTSEDKRRAVAMAEAAVIEFMRHHQRFRVDGRPWRLVINGDLFDFMSVFVGASEGVATHGHDERRLGAGRREDAAVARMRILGARYRDVFAQMMRFTGTGHRIDVIVGNHDQELMWPAVWAEMRRALLAACPTGVDADAALARIAVHRWFIYEPGVAWIEHGHQYDEACSFEYGLAATDPRTGELATNIDYAALRHLGSAAPDVDTHGTEEWSFGGYMQYAISQGPAAAVRYLTSYGRFVGALLGARKVHRSVRIRRARATEHGRALAELSAQTGVDRAKLDRIDALARSPITKSSRRLARMLRLDRVGVCVGVFLLALTALIALPLWAGVIAAAVLVAGGYKATELIGPAPIIQAAMPLVPVKIREIVDAPAVVFGHTHEPLRLPLANGGHYLNSGTWLPAIRPGLLRAFTHVAILRDANGGARTELRQWKDGQSRLFVEKAPVAVHVAPVRAPAAAPSAAPVLARIVGDTTRAA
jgi:UDP-2,3-diacylglucosamine pyrophosphatase LpxH